MGSTITRLNEHGDKKIAVTLSLGGHYYPCTTIIAPYMFCLETLLSEGTKLKADPMSCVCGFLLQHTVANFATLQSFHYLHP
jgi:hypothetical protein